MKNKLFYTLMVLLFPVLMCCQDTIPDGYYMRDHIFEKLDPTLVPTGLLFSYGIPFSDLPTYDGSEVNDTNYVSYRDFTFFYATVAGMLIDSTKSLPDPEQTYLSYKDDTTNVISLLFYEYSTFRDSAVYDSSLVFENGQIDEGPNTSVSPYEQRKTFVAATLRAINSGLTESFKVSSAGFLSNVDTTGLELSIDFDDGAGFQSVDFDVIYTIQYSKTGTKDIIVKLELGTEEYLGHSHVEIEEPTNRPPPEFLKMYNLSNVNTLMVSGATVTYLSACDDNKLRKPLIAIDGFDPPEWEEFSMVTNEDFYDLLDIANTPEAGDLLQKFSEAGYDLVFVDWDQGSQSLNANAEVVKAVIQAVNLKKETDGSTEENVVLGISMGGVVGKLALREMEIANIDHETELLITFDSPLGGANLPLGFQFAVDHVANIEIQAPVINSTLGEFIPELGAQLDVLNSPAARQMLIYHHDSSPSVLNTDALHFYLVLNNLGPLEDCEQVAISNGSQLGQGQGFNPGDLLFEFEGSRRNFVYRVEIDIEAYAMPDQPATAQTIYYGMLKASFGLGPFQNRILYGSKHVKIGGSAVLPVDSSPGGYADVDMIDINWAGVAQSIFGSSEFPGSWSPFLHDQFCFIPALSSIGYGPIGIDGSLIHPLTDISGNSNVTSSGLTTVNRYVAADNNPGPSSVPPNQFHYIPTLDISGFILYETRHDVQLNVIGTLDQVYNFGNSDEPYDYSAPVIFGSSVVPIKKTTAEINNTVSIISGGEIWVNRIDKIGLVADNNPQNASGTHFELDITEGGVDFRCSEPSDTPPKVNVDGGAFIIGDYTNGANSATVNVQSGAEINVNSGELLIEDQSRLVGKSGSIISIDNGGLVTSTWGSRIILEDGSLMRVKQGGILRIMHYSALDIEDGGTLIIEDGAVIQLWDGQDPDGAAHIKVSGELVIDRSFDFSGNGFFDFYSGHTLTLGANFELDGMGKDFRFLRANQTVIDFDDSDVTLKNGEVQYVGASSLVMKGASAIVAENVLFEGFGGQSTALDAVAVNSIEVTSCEFSNVSDGIKAVSDIQPGQYSGTIQVEDSDFDSYSVAVSAIGHESVNINRSDFLSSNFPIAILLESTETTRCYEVNIDHVAQDGVGLLLEDAYLVHFTGGEIKNCFWGVEGTIGKNNIVFNDGAVIKDSEFGVEMLGGTAGSSGSIDYGSVTMDCASLINNEIGIKGEDILLNIDAIINSQGQNPNTFINSTNGRLFEVCYLQRDITEVFARRNYWGGTTPDPLSYLLVRSSCVYPGGGILVSLITDPIITEAPLADCSGGDPIDDPNDLITCEWFLGGSQNYVHEQILAAMQNYLDTALNVSVIKPGFQEIADILNSLRSQGSSLCKHYVDLARTITEKSLAVDGSGGSIRVFESTELENEGVISIHPNPASNIITITSTLNSQNIIILNSIGQSMHRGLLTIDNTIEIDVSNWSSGIYHIISENGYYYKRFVVQPNGH